jgi:hypothetical protein
MTTVSSYARFDLTERGSTWGFAGWGTGDMTIAFDGGTQPGQDRSLDAVATGGVG